MVIAQLMPKKKRAYTKRRGDISKIKSTIKGRSKAKKKATDTSSNESSVSIDLPILKKIIKGNNNQDDGGSDQDKLSAILDSIISVCPKIKNDKQFIINKLTEKTIVKKNDYVLDKVDIPKGRFEQDKFNTYVNSNDGLYVDPYDNIINEELKVVGVVNRLGRGARYLFFETESTMPDKLSLAK
jgi:hypothetical protein